MIVTQDQMETGVAELEIYGLSIKTISLLEKHLGIYIGDLVGVTDKDLRSIPSVGAKTVQEIKTALSSFLRGDPPIVTSASFELSEGN